MSASVSVRRFGTGPARVLVHVPHAGTVIPDDVRDGIVLDDVDLAAEVAAMTDWHTDRLAEVAAEVAVYGRSGSVLVAVNRLSRLVVDPERFTDDREPMAVVGMGAVYTHRSDGTELRMPDDQRDAELIERYFEPYSEVIADLVDQILVESGRCLIVDLHSYPSAPLPYEADPAAERPEVCVGTDPFHTPRPFTELTRLALGEPAWEVNTGTRTVAVDTPFAGAYVPLRHLHRDQRVRSVMIEARRDVYLDEPSTWRDPDARRLAVAIGRFLRFALEPEGAAATGRGPCPACGSDAVVPLVYGMPGPAMAQAAQQGRIALGGCVIGPNMASLSCRSCDGRFDYPNGPVTWPWGQPR